MNLPEHRSDAPQLHSIERGVAPSRVPVPLSDVATLLHPKDDVAIARVPLGRGVTLHLPPDSLAPGRHIEVAQRIQVGHKVALRDISQGEPVLRYGSLIGIATQPISAGSHVHTHNLAVGEHQQVYEFGTDYQPVSLLPVEQRRTFMGYRRPAGRAGTRNYLAIISTVNCSASTVRLMQNRFTPEILRAYPNIDGVIGLTHKSGCGMRHGSEAVEQ